MIPVTVRLLEERIQPEAITFRLSNVGVVISGMKLDKRSANDDTTGTLHRRSSNGSVRTRYR